MIAIARSPRKPKPPKRVTLLDVAARAGVSRATASLVVRGSPLVTDETYARVVAAMEELGYVYNTMGHHLLAVGQMKAIVDRSAALTLDEACRAEVDASAVCMASSDTRARVAEHLASRRRR